MYTGKRSLKIAKTRANHHKQKAIPRQAGRKICCNPFNKNNPRKHFGKDLSPVSKWILKIYPQILVGSQICYRCRKTAKNQTRRKIPRTKIFNANATRAGEYRN